MPTARAIAREIVDNAAPVSIALIRQMMWRMLGADDPMEAHKIDSRGIYSRGASADVREGVMSFLEKRPANFKQTVSQDMPSYFPWWTEREYEVSSSHHQRHTPDGTTVHQQTHRGRVIFQWHAMRNIRADAAFVGKARKHFLPRRAE